MRHQLPLASTNGLWRTLQASGQRLLRTAHNLAFPPACLTCSANLFVEDISASQARFCPDCLTDLTWYARQPCCRRCGAPVGLYTDTEKPCLECRREKFAFTSVSCLGVYADGLREAVVRCKYLTGEPLLVALAELVWARHGEDLRKARIDCVVPIPQHWRQRLLSRHHAPDVLAEVWGRRLQARWGSPILAKKRWTRKQAHLNRAERHRNQHDVFRVIDPQRVRGGTILLVDDVLTTGATAHSAARALKAAGAKQVVVAVIARALGQH